MFKTETIFLMRDCDANIIPAGTPICLEKGTRVEITQALGGSFTVNIGGNLARIDGDDVDALGKQKPTYEATDDANAEPITEEKIWDVLKTVYDPEIPVSIAELGLIYDCKVAAKHVDIKMTLTAPACGMGDILVNDIKQKITHTPGVESVAVELVFDPPWDRTMISDTAKLQLGLL